MGKDKAAQIWTLQALKQLAGKERRKVSAGELARFMCVSRNTAWKRLLELNADGLVAIHAKNKGSMVTYVFRPAKMSAKGE